MKKLLITLNILIFPLLLLIVWLLILPQVLITNGLTHVAVKLTPGIFIGVVGTNSDVRPFRIGMSKGQVLQTIEQDSDFILQACGNRKAHWDYRFWAGDSNSIWEIKGEIDCQEFDTWIVEWESYNISVIIMFKDDGVFKFQVNGPILDL